MMIRQVFVALVVASVTGKRSPKIGLKGAAPSACGCQCSDLVWEDKYGTVHGNCRSADHTKAKWCYVKEGSTCSDLVPSARHPRNPWAYQACATPTRGRCGGSSSGFNTFEGNGRGQAGGSGSGGSQFNSGASNGVLAGLLYGGHNSGNRPSGHNQGGFSGQGSGHSSDFGSSHGSNGGFTGNQGGSGFSNGGQSSGFGGGSHSSQGQFSSAFSGSSSQGFTGGQGFGGHHGGSGSQDLEEVSLDQ